MPKDLLMQTKVKGKKPIQNAVHTSEFHVGDDDLFADAGECVLILKQMLVVGPLTHRCQELDGIAH